MLKRFFEAYLFFSRWALAPFFVMLTLGLFALMIKAGRSTMHMMKAIGSENEERITLELLGLVDLTLTGALVIIVAISVYENFVSAVDTDSRGWPAWMANIDFSALKLKLLSTIVAISAIKLLEAFMDVPELNERDLNYYIAIHVVFVISTLAFALAERVSGHAPAGRRAPLTRDATSDEAPHS